MKYFDVGNPDVVRTLAGSYVGRLTGVQMDNVRMLDMDESDPNVITTICKADAIGARKTGELRTLQYAKLDWFSTCPKTVCDWIADNWDGICSR